MRRIVLNRHDLIKLSESVLSQYGCFRFEAHGSSMYPFIRSGDILTVRPAEPPALNVGDVALYRAARDRAVAHRVVAKYVQDDHVETRHAMSLWMRGDAASGAGEQIRATQILGQVVSIQRGRKTIRVDRSFRRLIALLWTNLQFLRAQRRERGNEGACRRVLAPSPPRLLALSLSRLLCCLQRLRFYRSLARKLIREHVCYRVAGAQDAYDCSRFYGHMGRDQGIVNRDQGNPYSPVTDPGSPLEAFAGLKGYGYALIATVEGRIAGAVVIRQFPENTALYHDWWLFGLLVHTRYRGAGIGEGLVRTALQRAASEGAAKINLMVWEQNRAAINLYRKIGFRQVSSWPPRIREGARLDGQLNEDVRRGERRRIIMSLNLGSRE